MREPAAAAPQPDTCPECGFNGTMPGSREQGHFPHCTDYLRPAKLVPVDEAEDTWEARLPGRAGETTTEAVSEAHRVLDMLSRRLTSGLTAGVLALPLASALQALLSECEHIAGVAATHERARIAGILRDRADFLEPDRVWSVVVQELRRIADVLGEDGQQP